VKNLLSLFCFFAFLIAAALLLTGDVVAKPQYFNDKCSLCHSDDNETCNGCHFHGAQGLTATTDKTEYTPGELVTVTFEGGGRDGWFRALLYDQGGFEIDRKTGPTGTGDDRSPSPVEFPVTLTAHAPEAAGQHTWQAAWWGSPFSSDNETVFPHGPEVRTQVVFTVPESSPVEAVTWGRIKALWR
jgi:hypothetical protein